MRFSLLRTGSLDICTALGAGILIGRELELTTAGLLTLALLIPLLLRFTIIPKKFRFLPALFAVIGFALIIHANSVFNKQSHITSLAPLSKATINGKVKSGFKYFEKGYRFNMEVTKVNGKENSGLVQVSVYKGKNPPLPGDLITLKKVRLKSVTSFRNFGGFDYRRFMKDKKIGVRIGLSNEKKMVTITPDYPIAPRRWGEEVRRKTKLYIESHLPKSTASIASAMTVGISESVDSDTRRDFAVAGMAHLLAISGLHVGFITGFAYLIFYCLLFFSVGIIKPKFSFGGSFKKPAVILALFSGLIFVLSTGTKVSAVRAGIMVTIYLLSAIINREKEALNALAVSAIIILLFDPTSLFSASFQMSYMAVLAIVLLFADDTEEENSFDIPERKKAMDGVVAFFGSTIKISIAVGIAVAPIVIAHFSEVHFGGFLANIIAVPLASIAIPATLTGAFLDSFSSTAGNFFAYISLLAFQGIEFTAENFSRLSLFSFTGPPLNFLLIILYYTTIALWFLKNRYRQMVTVFTLIALLIFYTPWPRTATEIHFFDVGQGDATLIKLKSGENILIDGGKKVGNLDTAQFVIIPALHKMKIKKLDAVIATHGDNDHAGGLETILKRIKVDRFFENGQMDGRKTLEKIISVAKEKSIPYCVLNAGMTVDGSNGKLFVLHPDEKIRNERNVKDNNLSIVLLLKDEALSVLFMADMEKRGEIYLLNKNIDLKADFLKVGHHGSRTSSSAKFINAVSPIYAFVSAGQHNRYRYPSITVLRRFWKKKIKVMATKDRGEIILTLKNGTFQVFSP